MGKTRSNKWWGNRLEKFREKIFRRKTELGYVHVDHKVKAFFHFGGLKHGKLLSIADIEEMVRRASPYEEVIYALYRLDDKPHQSWARFLQMAKRNNDRSAIVSCLMLNELSATPRYIIGGMGKEVRDEVVKGLKEHKESYGPEYHAYIDQAIAELETIEYDPEGKMITNCCEEEDDARIRW